MPLRLGIVVLLSLVMPAGALAAAKPNLRVTSVAPAGGAVPPGGKLLTTVTTANAGKGRARASSTRLYLSLDAKRGAGDLGLGALPVPALKARKTSKRSVSSTVPAIVARGSYRLIACADDRKRIKETNERDNCRVAAATVTVGSVAAPGPQATVTPRVTPAPTAVATATPAVTAIPTVTASPSPTPSPSPSPTATPTVTPTPPDPAATSAQIAAVRATDGPVSPALPVTDAIVTKIKPAIGSEGAGFFVQAQATGPGVFVAIAPAALTPQPAVGDRVSFTVTSTTRPGALPHVTAIEGWSAAGTSAVAPLLQNLSAAADLMTDPEDYDSEIATVAGTISGAFGFAGAGFSSAPFSTAGVPNDGNLRVRAPSTLVDALDLANGCAITLSPVPMWRFSPQIQISPYTSDDVQVSSCPAPTVVSTVALSPTTVLVEFSRRIDPASVTFDASQFTADNGLVFSAATVDGRAVTLTSSQQVADQTYTVTVASTVKDQLGAGLGTPNSAQFSGVATRAVLRLTEVSPNVSSSRDELELKAVSGGTIAGITVRQAVSGTTNDFVTLPDLTVAAGDLILVHLTPEGATSTTETSSKTQAPAALYSRHSDTAWDIDGNAQGVTYTARVIEVRDVAGSLQDAVPFFATGGTNPSTVAGAVQAIQAAGHWLPADCSGMPCTTTSTPTVFDISVDWAGAGTTPAGNTAQRSVGSPDTNAKGDWVMGPHTLGAG